MQALCFCGGSTSCTTFPLPPDGNPRAGYAAAQPASMFQRVDVIGPVQRVKSCFSRQHGLAGQLRPVSAIRREIGDEAAKKGRCRLRDSDARSARLHRHSRHSLGACQGVIRHAGLPQPMTARAALRSGCSKAPANGSSSRSSIPRVRPTSRHRLTARSTSPRIRRAVRWSMRK